MRVLLRDIVLFSCLLAFVTGIVIAVVALGISDVARADRALKRIVGRS